MMIADTSFLIDIMKSDEEAINKAKDLEKKGVAIMITSISIFELSVGVTDTFEVKTRPALVLFKEYGNVVIAGITSNTGMDGVPFLKSEGAIKDSVIKLNYIFTVSEQMISKVLLHLTSEKRELIYSELMRRLNPLNL
jgi:uncharacterized protein with PIN domain